MAGRPLDKEAAIAMGGTERDLGGVDMAPEPQMPQGIRASFLPAEQPLCPACESGLYPGRQNGAGDTLFECLQGGCRLEGYQAIYRVSPPRWEPPAWIDAEGWRPPARQSDLAKAVPAEPAEKPAQAWPEGEPAGQAKTAGGSQKTKKA